MEAYLELRRQPRWFLAFALIAAASAACMALSMPFTRQVALALLSGMLSTDELGNAVSLSERIQDLAVFISPMGLLGKWLLAATFLYLLSVILDATEQQFGRIFATVVHAEIILVVMAYVNVFLLYLKGPEAMHGPTDLQAIPGLDVLLSDSSANIPLFTLLNGINPFSLWYVAVLSTGMSVMTGLRRLTSGIMVAALWLAGLGCQYGIAAIGNSLRAAVGG